MSPTNETMKKPVLSSRIFRSFFLLGMLLLITPDINAQGRDTIVVDLDKVTIDQTSSFIRHTKSPEGVTMKNSEVYESSMGGQVVPGRNGHSIYYVEPMGKGVVNLVCFDLLTKRIVAHADLSSKIEQLRERLKLKPQQSFGIICDIKPCGTGIFLRLSHNESYTNGDQASLYFYDSNLQLYSTHHLTDGSILYDVDVLPFRSGKDTLVIAGTGIYRLAKSMLIELPAYDSNTTSLLPDERTGSVYRFYYGVNSLLGVPAPPARPVLIKGKGDLYPQFIDGGKLYLYSVTDSSLCKVYRVDLEKGTAEARQMSPSPSIYLRTFPTSNGFFACYETGKDEGIAVAGTFFQWPVEDKKGEGKK